MVRDQSPLNLLIDAYSPHAVLEETKTIISMTPCPVLISATLDSAFSVIKDLFQGLYPGYRDCNTHYHDLFHTNRRPSGHDQIDPPPLLSEEQLSAKNEINLGIVAALMHDTGYIQTENDATGTGAKYTLNHIRRSIYFTHQCYAKDFYFKRDLQDINDILNCTGLSIKINDIRFSSAGIKMLGQMLGTADLLGQMADQYYVDKLTSLYTEFLEGHIQGFESERDLLQKTIGFYDVTKRRFVDELGSVNLYMKDHFRERWQIDRDLYMESIGSNIDYLKWLLQEHPDDYRQYLQLSDHKNQ